jgi:hypothetical protein
MNVSSAASLLMALTVARTNTGGRIWTVDEVHRYAWELHGKITDIRGWLPKCKAIDCTLFASKSDAQAFWKVRSKPRLLEIGPSRQFDSFVAGKLPAEIVLRAKVDATCIEPRTVIRNGQKLIMICVDRVNELTPVKIIKLEPTAPSGRPKS